jgi:glycosyltransferase involved in cell wall biosynthesis
VNQRTLKLAIITCYTQLDYVRGETLLAAARHIPGITTYSIKNSVPGWRRYAQVLVGLIVARVRRRPGAYLLTFRGYEILPLVSILTWPSPLIFDEYINPLEWLDEHRDQTFVRFVPRRLLKWLYRLLLRRCSAVLADTQPHATYSKRLTGAVEELPYCALPVSADERLFKPRTPPEKRTDTRPFTVFYYGKNMLPLHGLQYVLDVAVNVKDLDIEFVLAGGDEATKSTIDEAQRFGARVTHVPWIDYRHLPAQIYASDLCLGGPFGNTTQAAHVITTKTYQFMACGAPTLVGRTEAMSLMKNRENCLSVPLGDSRALATEVTWAYNHPKELAAIGENGRKLYELHFSTKQVAQQLAACLWKIL